MILFLKKLWQLLKLRWFSEKNYIHDFPCWCVNCQRAEDMKQQALASRLQRCREWRQKENMNLAASTSYADTNGPIVTTHT
jgi:hypothetical protein